MNKSGPAGVGGAETPLQLDRTREQEALERARRGEPAAFEPVVKAYMRWAYRIALGYTGDEEAARDLSQEAFIRAYRRLQAYDPGRPFRPWLYGILKYGCLTYLRKRGRRREAPLEVADGVPDPSEPAAEAERTAVAEEVWAAIGHLAPTDREIILLREFEGFSYRELAELLEIPLGTVMSRLHHARRRLRALLEEAHEDAV